MDDGMDSDEDLLLTRSSFSQESLLPNFCIGPIVDGILNNDNFGQQNSERNLVDQSTGTEKWRRNFKSSILHDEVLGMRKESGLKELYPSLLYSIYTFCWL